MQRGFTLLEIAIALAIVTTLAGLSYAALGNMKKRATYSNATTEVAQALRRMRAEAVGRGITTAFVVDTTGKRWWGVQAPAAGFNLDTFDPTAPGTVLASGTLPSDVSFAASSYAALPAPFAQVPVTTAQGASLASCSFCKSSGTNSGFGAVLFTSNGAASFAGASAASSPTVIGQQFSIKGTTGNLTRTFTVAVIRRSGVIEVFEQ
ncbi:MULTISPECIES: Tfp pilus assembly protein FimT/FimU [Myxococcaceae]|uniref:pilus assembly FimT family protein n=1 Tax=Myxococcaceae TaxID=31 RepID=UPI00188F5487|nr:MULTISPECIES: prepilin-type N-terminal cleavage/methylation domain-containing protein [Myxococcaceae]MBF5042809.1 prepilin-type N-terminal cleavage/methylation domain-containing protein [Simulacricoccus sp. 17bor-14]